MIASFLNSTGYIYFIQVEHSGPIKIGIAKDPQARLNHLQSGNPFLLRLLYCFPAVPEIESLYHYAFREECIKGEWFWPSAKLLKQIKFQEEKDIRQENWNWLERNPEKDLTNPHPHRV